MSENNISDSAAPDGCKVVSKYFSDSVVMDESSLRAKKDTVPTAKTALKPKSNSKKPKKKIKGQKDIRTLVKSKKNELLSYTKDFNLICKKSGIDVDSEQLQLAIALSKSLQDSNNDSQGNSAKPLTATQRKGRIRTTLQEYGFTVPEIKNIGKKRKKLKKQYKLLLTSDVEKQQSISERYAQVLFVNVGISRLQNDCKLNVDYSDAHLFNLSSNVPYDFIKNDDIFYIENIAKKSTDSRQNTLKDWSKIPGRPVSPKLEVPNISFNSIECSQEELNTILSGTIETSHSIIKRNYNKALITNTENHINNLDNPEITSPVLKFKSNTQEEIHTESKENTKMDSLRKIYEDTKSPLKEVSDKVLQRSCSPDLFDDDMTIIMDDEEDKVIREEESTHRTTVRDQTDFMDLTECVNVMSYNNLSKQTSCVSQGSNNTRINPNDFMDLTGCVTASSQRILHVISDNVNGNTNQDGKENCNPITTEKNRKIETFDLTQYNDNFPHIQTTNCINKSLNDTIILNDEDYCNINTVCNTRSAAKVSEVINLVNEECNIHTSLNKITKGSIGNSGGNLTQCTKENEDLRHNFNLEKKIQFETTEKGTSIVNSELSGQNEKKTSDDVQNPCKNYAEMDLTQSSDSGDNLPPVPIDDEAARGDGVVDSLDDQYYSPKETNDTTNHLHDIDVVDPPLPTPKTTNKDSDDVSKCLDIIVNYEHFGQDEKKTNNDLQNPHEDYEGMDLTQSSDSADSIPSAPIGEEAAREDGVVDSLDNQDYIPMQTNDTYNYLHDIDVVDPPFHTPNTTSKDNDDVSKYLDSDNIFNYDKNPTRFPHELDDEEQSPKNTDKCNNKSDHRSFELNIAQSTKNNEKLYTSYNFESENDREFDNMLESVSKSKQKVIDYLKSIEQNDHFNRSYSIHSEIRAIEKNVDSFKNNDNNSIDLSQNSNSSEEGVRPEINVIPDELGKIDNISIDYDEVYIQTAHTSNSSRNNNTSSTDVMNLQEYNNHSKDEARLSLSQNSEVFEISDDEFNYSVHHHKEENFNLGGLSVIDDFLNRESLARRSKSLHNCFSKDELNCSNHLITDNLLKERDLNVKGNVRFSTDYRDKESTSSKDIASVEVSTPSKSFSKDKVLQAQTPGCGDYIINTDRVTPKPDYERMTTPERNIELDKYGIKPLKRTKAIQMLTHIYDQTHPLMEVIPDNEYESPSKKRKISDLPSPRKRLISIIDKPPKAKLHSTESKISSKKKVKSPVKLQKAQKLVEQEDYSSKTDKENYLYMETKNVPDIGDIQCCPDDWFFQKREKAKLHTCRVPLHVAFHNYVSCRRLLKEAILKYEPINIDAIHKGLVATGYRYNPKDLLKFMDKKCITVKTADNLRNARK